jgi:hypothetical protein
MRTMPTAVMRYIFFIPNKKTIFYHVNDWLQLCRYLELWDFNTDFTVRVGQAAY